MTGDNAYPLLVLRLLPAGVQGLMIAALLAALMSSLSSVFNSCSTLLTMDVYKRRNPEAAEKTLVFVGRMTTAVVVVVSILWIPFIQHLNTEIYQYLQSIQASLAAPITATFLIGILWKGATARAALTTLVFGGIMGGGRFLLDVLHNGLGWDLGGLNTVVEFSFLNFSVILFFVSVGLMFWLSQPSEQRDPDGLVDVTLDWKNHTAEIAGRTTEKIMTGIITVAIIGLWAYFG